MSVPIRGLLAALLLFLADQVSKWFVTVRLDLDYLTAVREITPFFNLRFVPNCGVSLGLFGDLADDARVRFGLVAVTAAISAAVAVWMWRERARADQLALGCVLGGAIGNICDRVIPAGTLGKVTSGAVSYPGCVIDFADLHFGEWRPFLVFNVADAAITVGVLVLLVRAFLTREPAKPLESPHA